MKNICVICDSEKNYACGFMEYVNRKKTLPFEAVACTSTEHLLAFAGKNAIDLLLIAEKNMDEEIERIPAVFTFILNEGLGRSEWQSYKQVYKYQACDVIMREIMESISESGEGAMEFDSFSRRKKEVIGVYSPCGGCRKTSFALSAAAVLSEERRVLFAEMTPFSGLTDIYDAEPERGLSDLLYYAQREDGNYRTKLAGMVYEGAGFDLIPPVSAPEDLYLADPYDWIRLFSDILEDSAYEVLVLDLGISSLSLIDFCTRVYLPLPSDDLSALKAVAFERALEKSRYRTAAQKIYPVPVPDYPMPDPPEEFFDSPAGGRFGRFVRAVLNRKGESLWNLNGTDSGNPGMNY